MSDALIGLLTRRWGLDEAAAPAVRRLAEAWQQGHTAVALEPAEAAALAGCPAVADGDGAPRPLIARGGLLQAWQHAAAERGLARGLRALAGRPAQAPDAALRDAYAALYPDPDEPQARAVALGLRQSLALITGGPGTGKTHTAARLLGLLLEREPGLRFALAAPTGKAAQRLGESVAAAALDPALRRALPRGAAALAQAAGRAHTLHRLLAWRPGEDACGRNARRPLDVDLLVVDEGSMLDLMLWNAALAALPEGCRLVVLGDPMQLESIEPGRVLGSLVEAARGGGGLGGCLAELTRNWRFERHPGIGNLARAVLARDPEAALAALDGAEAARVEPDDAGLEAALDAVWPRVLELARAPSGPAALAALQRLRLLAVLNEGPWGVEGLNARVRRRLEREGLARHARPVLVTANDPQTGLFNGDLGAAVPEGAGERAWFAGPGGPRSLPAARLPETRLAWAITVHRSQGSEYDAVVLALPPQPHPLAGPELLYTAVTRARERVTLAATPEALRAACRLRRGRVTGLAQWL